VERRCRHDYHTARWASACPAAERDGTRHVGTTHVGGGYRRTVPTEYTDLVLRNSLSLCATIVGTDDVPAAWKKPSAD